MDTHTAAPFEGPEKLLEVWFAPTADAVPDAHDPVDGKTGLRKVPAALWEDMLDTVKCKVLSTVVGEEMDAYLLSESSLFISAHRLILKTCGTTLNLLGLPRILEIASSAAGLSSVHRCFYSRKSFMFPDRQLGPHRDWKHEVEYLDNIFKNGAAYIVGKMNGDHWLLYMTTPDPCSAGVDADPLSPKINGNPGAVVPDYTIEILMSELSPDARRPFLAPMPDPAASASHARDLSDAVGITDIFPPHLTKLDAYSFCPCGYSSNALIKWDSADLASDSLSEAAGEGYYTIHVTPEDGCSYASFECNVPLPAARPSLLHPGTSSIPDLQTLVRRVASIFQPGRLTLTLFISSKDNEAGSDLAESAVEAAQKAFKAALVPLNSTPESSQNHLKKYKRTDKINYEFGDYDLAFATFECSE